MTHSLKHMFVVPAYGKSEHLGDCLRSLGEQRLQSPILVSTSTPFEGLAALCEDYGARLFVHSPNLGIGNDWNAALVASEGDLVTIAHQDDVYSADFTSEVLAAHERRPSSSLYFCNADEITGCGDMRRPGRNHMIKQAMVAIAYAGRDTIAGPVSRRMLLGFGNPIVCPTVTINRRVAPNFLFREELRTNMDWLAWLELSRSAPLTRINKSLVSHRVHLDSETARCIGDGARRSEDTMVFRQLWPSPLAKLLAGIYGYSYGGYI